jgi:hypothetical protein
MSKTTSLIVSIGGSFYFSNRILRREALAGCIDDPGELLMRTLFPVPDRYSWREKL